MFTMKSTWVPQPNTVSGILRKPQAFPAQAPLIVEQRPPTKMPGGMQPPDVITIYDSSPVTASLVEASTYQDKLAVAAIEDGDAITAAAAGIIAEATGVKSMPVAAAELRADAMSNKLSAVQNRAVVDPVVIYQGPTYRPAPVTVAPTVQEVYPDARFMPPATVVVSDPITPADVAAAMPTAPRIPWAWIAAAAAVGVGAYMYGRR